MSEPYVFPGLTAGEAQATAEAHRAKGATAEIVPGEGGLFAVKVIYPDQAADAGANPGQAQAGGGAQAGANAGTAQGGANAAGQAQAAITSFATLSRQSWPHDPQEKDGFYGNPRPVSDGNANPAWQAANLVPFTFPWTLKDPQQYLIHKKCKDSLDRILAWIWDFVGRDQAKIAFYHLDETGGTFVPRANRNNPAVLSNHSYGIAIDLAPDQNPNRAAWVDQAPPHLPRFVIQAFKAEGWRWGGDFNNTKDAMHFEAVFDQHHDQQPVPAPKPGEQPAPLVA
jgi:hypothetical protein